MRMHRIRYVLLGILMLNIFFYGQETTSAALSPVSNKYAQVKAGEEAPVISLPNLQGQSITIVEKGKPTVLIGVHELRIKSLKSFQSLYKKNKQFVNFCIVSDSTPESIKQVFDLYGFTIPVVIDNHRDYLGSYNSTLPSMAIVDKKGIVRYNGTTFVDYKSLDNYITELIANSATEPHILLDPSNYVYQAPPIMNIGDVVTFEHFFDVEKNIVTINYNEKPTVLLIWGGFNSPQALDKVMPVMQEVYECRKSQANFYIINFASNASVAQQTLSNYNITVPMFIENYGSALRYTYTFPSFVIIDQNGVIRYRVDVSAEQLEAIIDSLNSK